MPLAHAKDDGPPPNYPVQVYPGSVLSSDCSTDGAGTTTCATDVSGGTALPFTVTVSNGQNLNNPQTYPLNATISGSGSASGSYLFYYGAFGQQPNDSYPSLSYVQGSPVTVTNNADLTLSDAVGSGTTLYYVAEVNGGLTTVYGGQGGGAIVGYSHGGPGFPDNVKSPDVGNYNGAQGGTVSITNNGTLDVQGNGGGSALLAAIAGYSIGGRGAAKKTGDTDYAGNGGDGGAVELTQSGSITLSNSGSIATIGVLGVSGGGAPGALTSGDHANLYGASGSGGEVSISHTGTITASGGNNIGIAALSIGGDGGLDTGHGVGSQPGESGPGGTVGVTLGAGSSIVLNGSSGIGVLAASSVGPSAYSNVNSSIAGGPVSVLVDSGATVRVTSSDTFAIGVAAISTGSPDVLRPFDASAVSPVGSGYSGSVSLTNNGKIFTQGQLAFGLVALSTGGAGVLTNTDGSGVSDFGNAAPSSLTSTGNPVAVINTGSVTTNGASAFGILAASDGAGGIVSVTDNATGAGITVLSGTLVGGLNGSGANGGTVKVTHSGTIVTGDGSGGGNLAIGILAQSVGGSGGTSGGTGAVAFVGDGGGTGGDGELVTVTTQGTSTISTGDMGALGILAQSIGGGGGNGGNAGGIFVAVGGTGGTGGNGGDVTVDLDNLGKGNITTSGHFSAGVVAQSVGGGGGNGGYATSVGVAIAASIGGMAGGGGDAGTVNVTNVTTLTTVGSQAHGIVAQAIGGGGGIGGAATVYSAGVLSISLGLGGRGGDGGEAGDVTVTNDYHIYTGCDLGASDCGYQASTGQTLNGANSVGILAQSIGGGGGAGGAATATALSFPIPDVPFNFAASFAVGGAGGSGGSGETVTVANAGEVATGGDGAYGILAQSIGGGGGNGGDATASTYALEGTMPSVKLSTALGGGGGVAGSGGSVSVVNGQSASCTGCDGQVVTFGQYATGILAQSIGGGGGTGGTGNGSASSPNLGGDTGTSIDVTHSVGGSGGSGNVGGAVSVTNDAGSTIATVGPGAQGILAQSIGGGGGAAGGGQSAASGDTFQGNFSVGGNGGIGNNGGAVTVSNAGTIRTGAVYTNAANVLVTTGGDGVGIFAQSIGGGGGTAGTSDAAANIDTAGQVEDVLNPPSASYSANIAIGGWGGEGGNGAAVAVTNTGTIATLGIRAYGIEAQSIGAGGGNAGAATSTSNSVLGGPSGEGNDEKSGTYSADVSVGGWGGAAGDGGTINITNSGSIKTAGYAAHALFMQSIGGGGGTGAEGTVDNTTTIGLGRGSSGSGGAGGYSNTISVADSGLVQTVGDDAYGILAQSIGGSGGHASAGCTNSADPGVLNDSASLCLGNNGPGITVSDSDWNDASDFTLNVGGMNGASGNGGAVTIDKTAGTIVTTGSRAFAIAAQSIGGGGGLVAAADVNIASANLGDGTSSGEGGNISISLAKGVGITTYGDGAFGILAQSIGGGGGFAGDASLALNVAAANVVGSGTLSSSSGSVEIGTAAAITTTGANAHGLFLQSLAGGNGGAYGSGGALLAGSSLASTTMTGTAGSITVNQTGGTISATGEGSIGIFAQSSGNSGDQSPISISIAGSVTGGSGAGAAGIFVSGGFSSNTGTTSANTIAIAAGGSVGTADGTAGMAIQAVDSFTEVTNAGILIGSVDLGNGGPGDQTVIGTLANSGLFASGATVTVASLTNTGTLSPFGTGVVGTTTVDGDFTQSGQGALNVDIDALASGTPNDLVTVNGSATVGGTIAPLAWNLLPGTYTVLTGPGAATSATAPSSLLFDWTVSGNGTDVMLTPDADFTPGDLALSTNAQSVGAYLQRTWDANGSSALAPLYGDLSRVDSAAQYQSWLSSLSGENRPSHASDQVFASRDALDSTFSCPVFMEKGTLLSEDECVWAKVAGGVASHWGTPDYQRNAVTFRLGGQAELAEGWFLGATAAYGFDQTSGNGGSSDGDTVDGGLALKRTVGPWYFAAGVNVGYNWYDETRLAAVGGVNHRLTSDSSVLTVGGRLRAAYEFAFDAWYLRPYADADLMFSHLPGHTERGPQGIALDLDEENEFTFAFSPMVEAGGRVDLGEGWTLRPYAAAGLLLLSNDTYSTTGRLVGAPAAAGSFQIESDVPDVLGRVRLGLEVYQPTNFDFRVEYDLQSGKDYLAQSGSLRLEYRF